MKTLLETLTRLSRSAAFWLGVSIVVLYLALLFIWQTKVIPEQKGFYSPFESSVSFIRYLGMITILNLGISISGYRRNSLWVVIPLIATLLILLLAAFYIYSIIQFE